MFTFRFSGMGMNTMVHSHESYYSDNKCICMLLSLIVVLKRLNFKSLYLGC